MTFERRAHGSRPDYARPFQCGFCGSRFRSVDKLEDHFHDIHPDANISWSCRICDEDFDTQNLLNEHARDHDLSAEDTNQGSAHDDRQVQRDVASQEFDVDAILWPGTKAITELILREAISRSVSPETPSEAIERRPGNHYLPTPSSRDVLSGKDLIRGSQRPKSDLKQIDNPRESRQDTLPQHAPRAMNQAAKTVARSEDVSAPLVQSPAVLREEIKRQSDEAELQIQMDYFRKSPRLQEEPWIYHDSQPLPHPSYEGRMYVPMRNRARIEVEVGPYSLQIVTGGSIFIFELPKSLVDAVLKRAKGQKALGCVRFGNCVGFFDEGVPTCHIRHPMELQVDFVQVGLNYKQARKYITRDVSLGNDASSLLHKEYFLW